MEGIFVSSAFGEVLVHPGVDGRRHLAASAQLDVAAVERRAAGHAAIRKEVIAG